MQPSYTRTFAGLLLAAGLCTHSSAQDAEPRTIGGFETQGSATIGYRFTDIGGYRDKYRELVNLNSGFRLLDFDLFGRAKPGENRFADSYSVTASGIGGEPFNSQQFTLRKNKVYELRANFRQSYYSWNRNDQAARPGNALSLTSNHDWGTVRKLGSVNLLVHASDNLKFSFEYYRNTRDGLSFITRSPDYFGSSSAWGSFARANPYSMIAPLDESANRVTFGVDYTIDAWTLHYRTGYQRFNSVVNGTNLFAGERSINIADAATLKEPLNGASWSDSRKLTTPVSEFSYTGKLLPRLQWRGSYLFYRYSGPSSLDMAFDGIGRTNSNGSTVAPYAFSLSVRGHATEPNHVLDQGFTYKIAEGWDFMADYRYARFSVNSSADFRSVNGTTIVAGEEENQWRVGAHTLDLNLSVSPYSSFLVRAGIKLMKNDVKALIDGVVNPTRTKRIKTVWPTLSVYWQPTPMWTVRADLDQINNGTSYTRVTPHIDVGGRFVVRFRPFEKLYIEDTGVFRNQTLLDTDYRSTIRSNAATINYEFDERYSGFAGFSYDSLYAANYVNFLRGTAPITNIALRDQTVNRVWQAGIRARPMPLLELSFTGNYVRTTGRGEITGEPPLYGPVKYPYATGSLAYDFPRVGRLMVELSRTYYIEEIVAGNNFGANLLTIAWRKGF
jgi:hypothetical protein